MVSFPTQQLANTVLASLRALNDNLELLLQELQRSQCTESEKRDLNRGIGRLNLMCCEMITDIAADAGELTSSMDVGAIESSIKHWREALNGETRRASLTFKMAEPYQFCSDRNLAESVTRTVQRCDTVIDESIANLVHAQCTAEALKGFQKLCGLLHTANATLGVMIFIDHPDLVPDESWRELLDDNLQNIQNLCQKQT
jgi:hypothetical protein